MGFFDAAKALIREKYPHVEVIPGVGFCGPNWQEANAEWISLTQNASSTEEGRIMANEENYVPPIVVVDVEGKRITNVHDQDSPLLHKDVLFVVYDYQKKYQNGPDKDENGTFCKQTNYIGTGGGEKKHKFRLYIRDGQVFRVVMPVEGAEVHVKMHPAKEGGEIKTQKWVRKKK